jgi:hypothetical protein
MILTAAVVVAAAAAAAVVVTLPELLMEQGSRRHLLPITVEAGQACLVSWM